MEELERRCRRILGIGQDAGPDEIKEAYRDLIKVWHPDRFSGDLRLQRKAQVRLADINLAYKHLVSGNHTEKTAEKPHPDPETVPQDSPEEPLYEESEKTRSFSLRRLAPILGFFVLLGVAGWFTLPFIRGDLAEVPFNVGASYLEAGNHDEACRAFRLSLLINPENVRACVKLGETYLGMGRYGNARAAFSEAIRINPSGLSAYLGLASAYGQLGSPEKEIQTYKDALRIAPDSLEAYYGLGLACERYGLDDEAREAFSRALLIDPQYESAQHRLALMYGLRGQYREAAETLERAAKSNPHDAGIYNDLGAMYEKLGLHMLELRAYGKAVEADPSSGEAHFNFAMASLRLGHIDAAQKELETLRALDPALAFKLYRMISRKEG